MVSRKFEELDVRSFPLQARIPCGSKHRPIVSIHRVQRSRGAPCEYTRRIPRVISQAAQYSPADRISTGETLAHNGESRAASGSPAIGAGICGAACWIFSCSQRNPRRIPWHIRDFARNAGRADTLAQASATRGPRMC